MAARTPVESQYEQWVKSLTIEELGKHLGKDVSNQLFEFIRDVKKVESFEKFIVNHSDGENDLELAKIYFNNIRQDYLQAQAQKLIKLKNLFNETLNLSDNSLFIELSRSSLSSRITESSPLPESFSALNLPQENIDFAKSVRKECAKIIGYFTDIKDKDAFFKVLVLRGKFMPGLDHLLNDKNKILELNSFLQQMPPFNAQEVIEAAFPGEFQASTRKTTPNNMSALLTEIFGTKISLDEDSRAKIFNNLFNEDSTISKFIENKLVNKNEIYTKKEKFSIFLDSLKNELHKFLGNNSSNEIDVFIESIKNLSEHKADAKYPPDLVYDGLDSFSSNQEAEVIKTIRENFNLSCKTSQMQIPLPINVDSKIATQFFKIDFIIHCPKLEFKDNKPSISPNTIFVGEYYGMVTKEDEQERALEKINFLKSKPNQSEEDIRNINRLEESIKYNEKTPIKQAVESRFATLFGCGTFSIFPSRTHGSFTNQIKTGLDSNEIIYNTSDGTPSLALQQLKNWYDENKNTIDDETRNIISKYIDIRSERFRSGESYRYSKYTVWIETIKLRLKTAHFAKIIEFKPMARDLWDLTKIKNCYEGRASRECYEDLIKLKEMINPPKDLINQLHFLNDLEKFLVENNDRINDRSVKQNLERLIKDPKFMFGFSELIKFAFNYNKLIKQGKVNKKDNIIIMDKLSVIQSLVRLAQIAESIEEVNPHASNLIDENIDEIASGFSGNKPEVNHDLFPSPIKTPTITDDEMEFNPNSAEQVAKQISDDIINSGDAQNVSDIHSENGISELNNLIDNRIKEYFG